MRRTVSPMLCLVLLSACGASSPSPASSAPAPAPNTDEPANGDPEPAPDREPEPNVDPEPDASVQSTPVSAEPEPPSTPTIDTEPSGTDGDGVEHFGVRMAGFPALAADGQSILIADLVEYGDYYVSVWSMANRERRRIALPDTQPALEAAVAEVRALIERGGYVPLRERAVHEATEFAPECITPLPCAGYDGATLTIRREGGEPVSYSPRRRRLLVRQGRNGRCIAGGPATPPFRVATWVDASASVVFVRSTYEATIHGCELEAGYRVIRIDR